MDAVRGKESETGHIEVGKQWKFSEIIAEPRIRERWEKVREYFFLRESTYDMTNRCNIRCEGCYYYQGDKQFAKENRDPDAWRRLMDEEKARGITYVVLAGAEPSLVPELCAVCFEKIPLGAIATNGLKFISESINYKTHISVWGDDETSLRLRGAKNMLLRQIENYKGDSRAVFVYTFNPYNIDQYNVVAHTHKYGLHDLYACSYPRMNPSRAIGLGRSFRQYRTDLTWDRNVACCVPDTDCADCRHYAAGSAVVTARLFRHATDPDTFKSWLDYVDTYLSVWVTGYEKGQNLCSGPHPPPGLES